MIVTSLSLPGCPLLKTRPGLLLAKTTAMLVMINTTGCPAPVSDRTRMKSLSHNSRLIAPGDLSRYSYTQIARRALSQLHHRIACFVRW